MSRRLRAVLREVSRRGGYGFPDVPEDVDEQPVHISGAEVKELRTLLGGVKKNGMPKLSQEKFGAMWGANRWLVLRWEAGVYHPGRKRALKMVRMLAVSRVVLGHGSASAPSDNSEAAAQTGPGFQ